MRCSPADQVAGIAFSAATRKAFRAEVLRQLVDWTAASVGTFQQIYPAFAPLEEAALHEVDAGFIQRSVARWNEVYSKELAPLAQASAVAGGIALDTRVLSTRERSRRAFYAEVFGPDQISEALYCTVGVGAEELATICLCQRAGRRSFSDDAIALVQSLLPVVSVAEAIWTKLKPTIEAEVPLARLTRRERQIVALVARRASDDEIALALGCSPSRIRDELSGVLRKAGVRSRAEILGRLDEGGPPAPPTVAAQFAASLSPRLRAVYELLLTGRSEKEIADRLALTAATLHQYVKAVYRAAGATSRAQLMAMALGTVRRGE